MRPTLATTACPLLVFLLCAAPAQPAPPNASDPDRVPWAPKGDAVNVPYCGEVIEVTKTSITIQFPNKKVTPKTFAVSETLAAGKIPKDPRSRPDLRLSDYVVGATSMYRLTDVKVGDLVFIHYAHLGDTDICDHICIQKRPGGRVPPLPEEAEELRKPAPSPPWAKNPLRERYIPYHEWVNAYWDLEDKGIPYPEKFGDARRWPVAPMPREVKLGSPAAP